MGKEKLLLEVIGALRFLADSLQAVADAAALRHIVDTYTIGEGSTLQLAVIFYLFNEGISILENAFAILEKLKSVLEQLREEKGE